MKALYSVGVEQGRYRGFVHRGEGVDMTTDPIGPHRKTYGEAHDDVRAAGGTIELSPLVRRLLGVAPPPPAPTLTPEESRHA